jgi:predicted O-methyltransferase YrrM
VTPVRTLHPPLEYLSKFHPVRKAIGVDIEPCPGLVNYQKMNPRVRFEVMDSQTEVFRRLVEAEGPFDLVLIDGDHTEEGCRRDFEMLKDHAKILVFHDIVSDPVPGVGKVWEEVKAQEKDSFDFFEYTDQYEEAKKHRGETLLGIGVAIRKNSGALQ